MITLYKNEKYIKNKSRLVEFVDLYFDAMILDKIQINDIDIMYMQKIDGATYLGDNYFTTFLGRTSIENLSTGCKTLILLNHSDELGNVVIDVSECGENALDYVFMMKNKEVLLEFYSKPSNFDKLRNVVVKVVTTKENEMTLKQLYSKDW